MIYRLFGFPTYEGLRNRIAVKYFNKHWMHCKKNLWNQRMEFLKQFQSYKVGDLVNTCSGFNGVIQSMDPCYIPILNGILLIDIDLTTTEGSCSFRHCGIVPAMTKLEVEKQIEGYRTHPLAKEWGWDNRYSPNSISINEDGTVTYKEK